MRQKVYLEIIENYKTVTFNMIFLDTGEIRQKRRSKAWLMRRVFFHELRTWAKNGEVIDHEDD